MRANADDRHHAAGLAELLAVGEEASAITGCTSVDYADVVRAYAGIFQLAAIGGHQVEMDLRTEIAVARSTLVQEQQRIAMWMALESKTSSKSSRA